MQVEFVGSRSALFGLALKTGFWTILTLGFYRFWMKTRLRRWYWSSIRPGGHPMEYTGDPIEKLLGFFIAVVVLTFYIGIVNLILMFISFAYFEDSFLGYAGSLIGVIPLWFYARYRARRYVLARTRWRGVRFGLEPGAWGYALRALFHWAVTILTAGLLWPRMTFLLEKYRTDRTFFGSAKLHQGGKWWMLYRAALPLIVVLVGAGVWGLWVMIWHPMLPGVADPVEALGIQLDRFTDGQPVSMDAVSPGRLWALPLIAIGLIYGILHYSFASRRIMAQHKLADGVRFHSALRAPRCVGIVMFGYFLAYAVLVLGVGVVLLIAISSLGFDVFLDPQAGGTFWSGLPQILSVLIGILLYLGVFLLWSVLHNTFVTFPLMRHQAETLQLVDHHGLGSISQRARDAFAEAEGFAEALDLGAAI